MSKNKENSDKNKTLNPPFQDLAKLDTFIGAMSDTTKANEPTPHAAILQELLKHIEPIDYETIAFPEAVALREELEQLDPKSDEAKEIKNKLRSFRITNHHFHIITIDNIIKVAELNDWGMCKNHDSIYIFNGAFWAIVDRQTLQKFLGEAAQRMGVSKCKARHFLFREMLLKQFLQIAYLPTPEASNDIVLVNLKNYTFEITPHRTKLRPFDRSDFITYQLPFVYDEKATAPIFMKYLNTVLPDEQSQKVLAEYLGSIFIKNGSNHLKLEKTLILLGGGANGKSVLFAIVSALLGTENTSNYSLRNLTEEKGYYRVKIANKLLNYASEISNRLDTAIFKQLVSGEPVEVAAKYGQPYTMNQYAKLAFNCNELPKDVEQTEAFFRRFLIINFDVTIPENERDTQLSDKIINAELSGVFNWVLAGLKRLLEQKKFSKCEAADKANNQYRIDSNSIALFLRDENYSPCLDTHQICKELFTEYKAYCIDSGMPHYKRNNFYKHLKALGVVIERQSGTGKNIARLSKNSN